MNKKYTTKKYIESPVNRREWSVYNSRTNAALGQYKITAEQANKWLTLLRNTHESRG